MHLILAVARFEYRYLIRQPIFYLFALLTIGQGVWYGLGVTQLYPGQDASAQVYYVLASLGPMLSVASALLAGQSMTKDLEHRTAAYIYASPIADRAYLAGRFLGTYLTALTLSVLYPLGMLGLVIVYPINADGIPYLALLDGYVRLVVINVFIVVSVAFSLTVFMRDIRGAYLVLFLVILYFLLTEASPDAIASADLWQLLDPFGVGMVRSSVESMYLTESPTVNNLFVFSDMLLINRLLWLGLALGLLAQAEATFSFITFSQQSFRRSRSVSNTNSAHVATGLTLPSPRLSFERWTRWQTLLGLARLEFLNLTRQSLFRVSAIVLVLLTVWLLLFFGQNPDFPDLPTTARMTAVRGPMCLLARFCWY